MKKISKVVSIILILSILISLIPISISNADENAGEISATFKDLNEAIESKEYLDNKYSYGGLFWSEDTEIIDAGSNLANTETQMFIDEPVSSELAESFPREMERRYVEGSYMVLANEGESIKLKITNCAIDEDGDLCDVVLEIDNIQDYEEGEEDVSDEEPRTYLSRVVIRKGYEVSQNDSNNSTHHDCNLINFSLYNIRACSDFKITYYKAGTNNLAEIEGVATTIYDFDVPNPNDGVSYPEYGLDDDGNLIVPNEPKEARYLSKLFQGNEGVVGLEDTTYYYAKNDYLIESNTSTGKGISTPLGVGARLYEATRYSEILEEAEEADDTEDYMLEFLNDRETRGVLNGTDGITTKTTCMLLQDQKAKFSMRYGGVGCGIFFVFVPLIPYEPSEPVKSVDVEQTKIGQVFHYTATQYIANNYNTSKLQLTENSNSILYDEVIMTDELNENLEIAETENDKIKVLNVNDEDISDWFTIAKENNVVTATVKEEKVDKEEFYNNTFKLIIPVKVKEGCTLKEIPNYVTTTFKQNGNTIHKDSNIVIVTIKDDEKVKYNVTLTVEVINGEKNRKEEVTVSAGSNNEFVDILIKPNKGYKLESLVIDGENIDVTKLTYNKDGSYTFSIKDENINKDIDHVVKAVCVKEKVPDVIPNAGATCGIAIAIVIIAGYAITRYRKMK